MRSTLTLLILVPRAPLPLEPARAPTRPCAPRTDPAALSPAPRAYTSPTYTSQSALPHLSPSPDPEKAAGTPKGAASAVDTTPFGWILQVDSHSVCERLSENYGAGDYGKRCPEGMLGVASALPGTRVLTAARR